MNAPDYERFEFAYRGFAHRVSGRIEARRVTQPAGDEVQLGLAVGSCPHGGRRYSAQHASVTLNVAEARRLALAICPEYSAIVAALESLRSAAIAGQPEGLAAAVAVADSALARLGGVK